MSLLEIKGLMCSSESGGFLGIGTHRRRILDDVTLSVEPGTIVGIIGESGSGKSTLARCIAGLREPESGTIVIDGTSVYPEINNRKTTALKIQMLFQGGGVALNPRMTIFRSLLEGLVVRRRDLSTLEAKKKAEELLSQVGLPAEVLTAFPRELSGGEQQRIALVRVLCTEPQLLILDEPTSGVDSLNESMIFSLLRDFNTQRGLSILYITHDVPIAMAFCDRVAVLYGGRIVEEQSPKEIMASPRHAFTMRMLADCRIHRVANESS